MATGKRYYWMKLKESFMTSDTIDYFMSQPNGANYVVLYQMLCLKTINTDGKLSRQIGEIIIPYDVEKIQRDCKWFSTDTIRIALNLYKSFGLIYEDKDGVLVLTDHQTLVGSETNWAIQKRNQQQIRAPKLGTCKRLNRETLLLPSGEIQYVDEKRYGGNGMKAFDLAQGVCENCGSQENLCIHHGNGYSNDVDDLYILCRSCHAKVHSGLLEQIHNHSTQTSGNKVEIEVENFHPDNRYKDNRDIDIRDEEEDITTLSASQSELQCPFSKIRDLYHEICVSYPKIKAIDGNRRKAVAARWRTYNSLGTFKELFQIAQASSFLKGQNDRNWVADFDWMMKPSNFSKILEHKYDNRTSTDSKELPLTGALGVLAKMREECGDDKE